MTFKTAGQVEVGGSVTLVMPDLTSSSQFGWNFDDAKWVNCTEPVLNAVSPAAVYFDGASRALNFAVHGSMMAQNTTYVFKIKNVITPSSVEPSNYIRATTRDSHGKIIDTTSDMVTDHILAGNLTGALTFETATDTTNFKSVATVTFTTAGQVRE